MRAHLPVCFHYPFTATLLLTTDAGIKRLNRDFRGMDKPTNVLSFPQFDPAALPKKVKPSTPVFLGDIALSYATTRKESLENNKLFENHLRHLLLHGLLHLFGYDHLYDSDAARMEKLEKRILATLGVADPYALVPDAASSLKSTLRKK